MVPDGGSRSNARDDVAEHKILARKYELLDLIGKGGMGKVYEARHVDLDSRVAVKLLNSSQGKERFLQEARVAAQIGHDNICPVLDIGRDEEGTSFLVMPLLRGESLRSLVTREGRLGLERAGDIALQVLSALSAAHAQNIVHRDIKPENIFLTQVAERSDFVKLLDFGISKILRPPSDTDETMSSTIRREQEESLTQEGALLGTPKYMSPEQAVGEKSLDHRADIYSLGVVLFLTLTGELPFKGQTHVEIITKLLTAPLPSLRSIRPDIPVKVEAVVLKALQRDPEDRFLSADAFRDALRAALACDQETDAPAPEEAEDTLENPAEPQEPATPISESESSKDGQHPSPAPQVDQSPTASLDPDGDWDTTFDGVRPPIRKLVLAIVLAVAVGVGIALAINLPGTTTSTPDERPSEVESEVESRPKNTSREPLVPSLEATNTDDLATEPNRVEVAEEARLPATKGAELRIDAPRPPAGPKRQPRGQGKASPRPLGAPAVESRERPLGGRFILDPDTPP
jgi:serine/threonine-protein kinase